MSVSERTSRGGMLTSLRLTTWFAALTILAWGVPVMAGSPLSPRNVHQNTAPHAAPESKPQLRLVQSEFPQGDPFESPQDTEPQPQLKLSDPLEPWNRGMFWVNDKAYFYALKPMAQGYRTVMPERGLTSVRNFFQNLDEPANFVNSLLQARFRDAGASLGRFVVNTTLGVGGFFDPASVYIQPVDRRFDQTFAKWGAPPGIYLVWPFIGPSSVRGTVGYVAGQYAYPVNYIEGEDDTEVSIGISVFRNVNEVSFRIGQYEDLKRSALDPYTALKNVYEQRIQKYSSDS